MKKRKTSNNRSRVFEIALEGGREWKFCLGELQSFDAFVMLKATFSKHWLVKLAWHVCTYSLEFKIWYNRNDCSYKWRLHRMITWKLLFDGEEMKLLIAKDLNVLRGIFWWVEWVNFCLLGRIFPHPQGFPQRFRGRENNLHLFGKKGNAWRVILEDNPALVLIGLFQINHNCLTEFTLQATFLLKLI